MTLIAPGARDSLIHVDRAIGDFRRGQAVVIRDQSQNFLVRASELIDGPGLDDLRALGGRLRLILTHARAQTLKMRLYTEQAIAVEEADTFPPEKLRALADPCMDLDTPMKGPFMAERRPDTPLVWTAGIQLAKLARLLPSVLLVDLPDQFEPGGLLTVRADEILAYEAADTDSLRPIVTARVPLADAPDSRLVAFAPADGGPEHLAIIIGSPKLDQPVLTRLHSECFTGDLIGSLKCDCGEQLRGAIAAMAQAGGGIVLYLAQEGRGIGLVNKLRAYRLQDQGFDTVEANERLGFGADEREFRAAARMLTALGYAQVRLLTNNPDKVQALESYGIKVAERVAHAFAPNPHNAFYLSVKRVKSGHLL